MARKLVACCILALALAVWAAGVLMFARGDTLFGAILSVAGGLLMLRLAVAYARTDPKDPGRRPDTPATIRDSFFGFWP